MSSTIIKFSILIVVLIIAIKLTNSLIKSYVVKHSIDPNRRKLILNIFYMIYMLAVFFISLIVLGIDFKQVVVFISSILAVLGVGFFAQWSMLSNLTASFILFFYHPMRIGDTIKIIDKEFDLTGIVKNITGFYTLIYLTDKEKYITIPNITVLYKGIELVDTKNNFEQL